MAKTANDVLNELVLRGKAVGDTPAALSYINQAADSIKAYCNLPTVPEGLFFAWVEVASCLISSGGGGGDNVASISEGDTSITFRPTSEQSDILSGFKPLLNRYRRMA
ncbi:MAG: hypothetical protein VB035_00760 [Candidatus Fimivivens sp.]|nr:hypothetical protein [Candidatus Fimivivens sp.]